MTVETAMRGVTDSDVARLIRRGVRVNGRKCINPAFPILPGDRIEWTDHGGVAMELTVRP